tara:strand:- start:7070 stop:7645 length:576 start_codon:yes stop_codon:yes gene_type:complete
MNEKSPIEEHSYLRRLPPEAYRDYAVVHWSMTIEERKQGWLTELFHARFRELLTHMAFRYHVICPSYVLMPDHLHLLLMGYHESSDQRVAMRYFRKQLNWVLRPEGFQLQKQGYDHVLREDSRKPSIFEKVAGYVQENPLRAGLVADYDELPSYPFAGCLVPGYPELDVWTDEFWESFWKLYWLLREREKS